MKINKLLLLKTLWMDLASIILNEKSKTAIPFTRRSRHNPSMATRRQESGWLPLRVVTKRGMTAFLVMLLLDLGGGYMDGCGH